MQRLVSFVLALESLAKPVPVDTLLIVWQTLLLHIINLIALLTYCHLTPLNQHNTILTLFSNSLEK